MEVNYLLKGEENSFYARLFFLNTDCVSDRFSIFFTEKNLKQLKDRKLRLSRILGQFSLSTRAVILMGWYRSKQGSNITEFYIGLAEVLAQLGET